MAGGPIPVSKKYTAGSKGIWEKIRQLLVPVPNRSTGNPIVPFYRVPSPGETPGPHYTEPETLPARDIAGNQYHNRDYRRNYPQTASYTQSTVAGLLLYGNAAQPRIADGAAGEKQLAVVAAGEESLTKALASSSSTVAAAIFDKNGQPPVPPSVHQKVWKMAPFSESGMYDESYPVRSFK